MDVSLQRGSRLEIGLQRLDRAFAIPRWAWLPVVFGLGDLMVAAFGYYWDVTWHIEKGRDEFIFTVPHTLIILGLLGVGVCGLLAHRLYSATETGGIRILKWRTAPGAVLLLVCGGFAVLGFPLDDLWHRFFGQDVTAWGPTHLLMISGAALTPLALAMLLAHGRARSTGEPTRSFKLLALGVSSAMLVGLSAYQAEFDFGVPQFQLLYHPILIAIAAGLVLVAARFTIGPWGALITAVNYIAIRGVIDLGLVIAGRGVARFPLYLATAIVVEVIARFTARRAVLCPVLTGLGIGTIGLFGEGLLLALWNYHPWSPNAFLVGMLLGSVAAVAAAFLGRAIAAWLRSDVPAMRPSFVAIAVVGFIVVMAVPLPRTNTEPIDTDIRLSPASATDLSSDEERFVDVAVRLPGGPDPTGADWFEVMAWQGGGQVIEPLVRKGSGFTFVTTRPVPIGGEWKTLLRYASGEQIVATPIYLPEDPAIGAHGFQPEPRMDARFQLDSKLLLREARGGPTWLIATGYAVVIAVAALWIGLIFWGLTRLRRELEIAP